MDAIERITVHVHGELPVVFVILRSQGPEPARFSGDWMVELRSALREAGLPTVPGAADLVVFDAAADGAARYRGPVVRVDWEPERRVPFEWPVVSLEELRRALESGHFHEWTPARRKARGRERKETRDDPECRANLHASALAVGLALLGLALVLQTIFRAN